MANYDENNKGAAFKPFDTQRLILQGKLNDQGKDMKIVLLKDQTKDGKNIIEVYEKIGVLFENDKKGNEAAPDYTGPLGMVRRIAAWKRVKDEKAFMSLSVSDKGKPQPAQENNSLQDDGIPF